MSDQVCDCGPKVQPFEGEFHLMRHRQFQNHHRHRKTEMSSGKFGNSQGDCPGFGMRSYTFGESESLTTRTAGPLALNDRLRAVPGPALRFSPGWQNDWAFGPKSQSVHCYATLPPLPIRQTVFQRSTIRRFRILWPAISEQRLPEISGFLLQKDLMHLWILMSARSELQSL